MDTARLHDRPPSISIAALARRIGTAAAPLVADVRRAAAYEADAQVIAGALRILPDAVGAALARLPKGRPIVVYCVHGHEVSQGAARDLVQAGADACFLEGGIGAWREAGLPLMRKMPELGLPATPGKGTRWVTRERPKIDRIACPWLIRRFLDPLAEFLYVPAAAVTAAAQREGATPYDVPGVRISHRGDAGERCSFDALLDDSGIDDRCLADLACIVRGADTGRCELTPESAGLLAVSLGLSVNHADDHAMLDAGMVVYDALCAWLRAARAEVHNADLFRKP
ncbi:MAG: chromate resistance protein [Burkholderiales bacterium]|nr:chromate resistance protein [Burkholderiales bacterium]